MASQLPLMKPTSGFAQDLGQNPLGVALKTSIWNPMPMVERSIQKVFETMKALGIEPRTHGLKVRCSTS